MRHLPRLHPAKDLKAQSRIEVLLLFSAYIVQYGGQEPDFSCPILATRRRRPSGKLGNGEPDRIRPVDVVLSAWGDDCMDEFLGLSQIEVGIVCRWAVDLVEGGSKKDGGCG